MKLSVTDRYRLRALKITPSVIAPKGRVIWWQGRKRLGFGDFDKIATIPAGADGVQVSIEDHPQLDAELFPNVLAAG